MSKSKRERKQKAKALKPSRQFLAVLSTRDEHELFTVHDMGDVEFVMRQAMQVKEDDSLKADDLAIVQSAFDWMRGKPDAGHAVQLCDGYLLMSLGSVIGPSVSRICVDHPPTPRLDVTTIERATAKPEEDEGEDDTATGSEEEDE